jgi:hypothetical protein
LIESRKDMVANTGSERVRSREAWSRWWEKADLAKAETDPATRVDSVVI